jgi:ribosomal protein S25
MLCYPEDYIGLLPQNLPDQFTNQQLAKELKIKTRLARKMTYTLRSMGVLNIFGKNRNEFLFEICL